MRWVIHGACAPHAAREGNSAAGFASRKHHISPNPRKQRSPKRTHAKSTLSAPEERSCGGQPTVRTRHQKPLEPFNPGAAAVSCAQPPGNIAHIDVPMQNPHFLLQRSAHAAGSPRYAHACKIRTLGST